MRELSTIFMVVRRIPGTSHIYFLRIRSGLSHFKLRSLRRSISNRLRCLSKKDQITALHLILYNVFYGIHLFKMHACVSINIIESNFCCTN